MLPIIYEDNCIKVVNDILKDVSAWRKGMIHYIKDENPELNSAIIEIANKTSLDPKAVATGAYMAYILLENAQNDNESSMSFEE